MENILQQNNIKSKMDKLYNFNNVIDNNIIDNNVSVIDNNVIDENNDIIIIYSMN